MSSFFNFLQWIRIGDIREDAGKAGRVARRAEMSVAELQVAVERLQLGCLAMWEILQEKTDVTEEDLSQRITELDLRDGVLNGKMAPARRRCISCQRENGSRRLRCLYCGSELSASNPLQP